MIDIQSLNIFGLKSAILKISRYHIGELRHVPNLETQIIEIYKLFKKINII